MSSRFIPKIFAENATDNVVFGSWWEQGGNVGDGTVSNDPATLQGNAAWPLGLGAATNNFFKLMRSEELNGVLRVITTAILQQMKDGLTFWQSEMPVTQYQTIVQYQTGSDLPKLYINITGTSTSTPPDSDTTNWYMFFDTGASLANVDLSNLTANGLTKIFKTGMIIPWGGTSSNKPDGWLVCDGSAISRTTYADLFDVIGEEYGTGDGTTTFNLPDFTGKWAAGNGNGYLSAGLPDIQGATSSVSNYGGWANGAFYNSTSTANVPFSQGSVPVLNFKASNSNSIYGSSSTVQPPTCKTYWLIKY